MLKGRAVVLAILMMTSSLSLVLVNQVPSNIDISEDKIFTSSPEEKILHFLPLVILGLKNLFFLE